MKRLACFCLTLQSHKKTSSLHFKQRPGARYFPIFLLLLALTLSASSVLQAQTPFPMLGAAWPLGVTRGKTTEVTVYAAGQSGNNLYAAYKAVFAGAGVHAEIVPPEKGWPAKDPKNVWALPNVDTIKMRVTIAPDAALGVREFRVATPRQGPSTVGQLFISDEPETDQAAGNIDLAHAMPVSLPCSVNGRIQNGEEIDYYKFKAEAGQEVVFSLLCARIQDKVHDLQEHADPLLILCDDHDVELGRNDDFYRADSLLFYHFTRSGNFILKVRDINYHGNPAWVYRLQMTNHPWVIGVLPCAVRPGESLDLQVSGYNLGSIKTTHLIVPGDVKPGLWTTTLPFPQGHSNLIHLLVTAAPQTVVLPPPPPGLSGGQAKATTASFQRSTPFRMSLPDGIDSVLTEPNQIDRYTFHAKKGAAWGFEVTSRRLEAETDSEIKIKDGKGQVLAENDDTFGKDSRIEWTAPEEGDYTLEMRDLAGKYGPTYFYNLTAQRLLPDFALRFDPGRAMIAPGNRTAWFVLLERKNGFSGPVAVEMRDLPTGVTASPLTIPSEMTQGVIVLSAAPDAKIDMTLVQVFGTAALPGQDVKPISITHAALSQTEIYMPGGGRGLENVETAGVAVTEQNDIEVSVASPNITLVPGGEMKIEVLIKRRPDYTKSVTLDLRVNHLGGIFTDPLPPGITIDADAVTIPDNQNKGTITLKAAPDAKPIQNWPLAIMGNVSINFVMKVWYVAPITLTITAPPVKK